MEVTYSAHAVDMLIERKIEREWVERTIVSPESTEPDPIHKTRWRSYRAIPERDGRVLRVVYTVSGSNYRVITIFLDRGRGRNR